MAGVPPMFPGMEAMQNANSFSSLGPMSFDKAAASQFAAMAAMSDMIRASQQTGKPVEVKKKKKKASGPAPAFDKDALARLAAQASESSSSSYASAQPPPPPEPGPPLSLPLQGVAMPAAPVAQLPQAMTQVAAMMPPALGLPLPPDVGATMPPPIPAATAIPPAVAVMPPAAAMPPTAVMPSAASLPAWQGPAQATSDGQFPQPAEVKPLSQLLGQSQEHKSSSEVEMMQLRERAEKAEAELAALKASLPNVAASSSSSGGLGVVAPGGREAPATQTAKGRGDPGAGDKSQVRNVVDNVIGALKATAASSFASAAVAPRPAKMTIASSAKPQAMVHFPEKDIFLPNAPESSVTEQEGATGGEAHPRADAEAVEQGAQAQSREKQPGRSRRRSPSRRSSSRGRRRSRSRHSRRRAKRSRSQSHEKSRSRSRGRSAGRSHSRSRSRSRSRSCSRSRLRKRRSPSRRRSSVFSSGPAAKSGKTGSSQSRGAAGDDKSSSVSTGYAGAKDPRTVNLKPDDVPDWLQDLASPVAVNHPPGFYMGRKVLRMPDAYIKCLIGRGGETIRQIRTKTGADIKIEGKTDDPEGVVSIAGNVDMAEQMIRQVLASKGCFWEATSGPGVLLGGQMTNVGWKSRAGMPDDLQIPTELVGLFIGNSGCGFKEMKARVGGGVTIKVLPEILPGGFQSIQVVGDRWREAREVVRQKIEEVKLTTPGRWHTPGFGPDNPCLDDPGAAGVIATKSKGMGKSSAPG